MLGLILLLAIAYCAARGLEAAIGDVSAKHKKRIKKTSAKKGRRTGAKLAAWAATCATAAGPFCKGFVRGWKREWPKAKERAAAKLRRQPEPIAAVEPEPAPAAPNSEPISEPAAPAEGDGRKLVLIKNDDTQPTTGERPMALATIPEITGVNTLKQAVARFASEATVTAEEAGAIAQRAQDQLAAIEAAIEQAGALEFGDDGGTLEELAALRDQYAAALAAAQAMQTAAVDNAAIAAQSSRNIHSRHGGIQEAVAATGGRMASKQAYTADV